MNEHNAENTGRVAKSLRCLAARALSTRLYVAACPDCDSADLLGIPPYPADSKHAAPFRLLGTSMESLDFNSSILINLAVEAIPVGWSPEGEPVLAVEVPQDAQISYAQVSWGANALSQFAFHDSRDLLVPSLKSFNARENTSYYMLHHDRLGEVQEFYNNPAWRISATFRQHPGGLISGSPSLYIAFESIEPRNYFLFPVPAATGFRIELKAAGSEPNFNQFATFRKTFVSSGGQSYVRFEHNLALRSYFHWRDNGELWAESEDGSSNYFVRTCWQFHDPLHS